MGHRWLHNMAGWVMVTSGLWSQTDFYQHSWDDEEAFWQTLDMPLFFLVSNGFSFEALRWTPVLPSLFLIVES